MESKEKIQVLVKENIITQEVADKYSKAFTIFVDKIVDQLHGQGFYPEPNNMFRALNECPKPKVVILGQDPYHDGSANGLAFDNNFDTNKVSPSLKNILKELFTDLEFDDGELLEARREVYTSHLEHLPQQGVLLLNTALTVKPKEAGSHTDIWKEFTDAIVDEINGQDDVAWIRWGTHAKAFQSRITNTSHYIITGVHPMPLAANRGGFFGGKYFSKTNAFLHTTNQSPINW